MQSRTLSIAIIGMAIIMLNGCGKEKKYASTIRSIKYTIASKHASFQLRKFSGVVFAVNYAYMSFEDISGRVSEVKVDIGDMVKKNQIMAVMKRERFELDVKDAKAALSKSEAGLAMGVAEYEREKELLKKNVSFQRRLEARKFQYRAAISDVKSSKARLGLAKRNLRNTDLRAPYDGYIGARNIESNQEVKAGQKIFRIDAVGDMEVKFDIPENIIKRTKVGMMGNVRFSSYPNQIFKGEITFLGTAANRGNAFPVKIQLINPAKNVYPGMTAEVSLELAVMNQGNGFLLPLSAILPTKQPQTGYIFIYNPKTKRLRKVKINTTGTVNNLGIVEGDIANGDIIATAGVSFLADKMEVKLLKDHSLENKQVSNNEQSY